MRIIANKGDDAVLIDMEDGRTGRVLDVAEQELSPPIPLKTLLSHRGWEPYHGSLAIDQLLHDVAQLEWPAESMPSERLPREAPRTSVTTSTRVAILDELHRQWLAEDRDVVFAHFLFKAHRGDPQGVEQYWDRLPTRTSDVSLEGRRATLLLQFTLRWVRRAAEAAGGERWDLPDAVRSGEDAVQMSLTLHEIHRVWQVKGVSHELRRVVHEAERAAKAGWEIQSIELVQSALGSRDEQEDDLLHLAHSCGATLLAFAEAELGDPEAELAELLETAAAEAG